MKLRVQALIANPITIIAHKAYRIRVGGVGKYRVGKLVFSFLFSSLTMSNVTQCGLASSPRNNLQLLQRIQHELHRDGGEQQSHQPFHQPQRNRIQPLRAAR
jgi:hypothetical protein